MNVPIGAGWNPLVTGDVASQPDSGVSGDEQDRAFKRTREAWLLDGVEALGRHFEEVGRHLPDNIRVSVGFPKGRPTAIGQCFPARAALDGSHHIFISPVLEEPIEVLAVLTHEVIHAVDDCRSGHRAEFSRVARLIGLVGPTNSTSAGDTLREKLSIIAMTIGPYPHRTLGMLSREGKTQSTRMLKVSCPACGYLVRTTKPGWFRKGLQSVPMEPECN